MAKETTYGTAGTVFADVRALSAGLEWSPNYQRARSIEGGIKLQSGPSIQPLSEGAISFEPRIDIGLGEMLMALFGVNTISGAADPFTHTFTPKPDIVATLKPSWTFEIGGDEVSAQLFTGGSVRSLALRQGFGKLVVEARCFAKKPTTPVLATVFTFTSLEALHYGMLTTMTVGGTTVILENLELEITTNEPRWGFGTTTDPIGIDIVPLSVRLSNLQFRYLANTHVTDFLNGTNRAVVIKWLSAATPERSLQMNIKQVKWDQGMPRVDAQNRVVQILASEGEDDGSGAAGVISAVLLNAKAVAY